MKTTEEIFEILKKEFNEAIIEHIKEVPTEEVIVVDPL